MHEFFLSKKASTPTGPDSLDPTVINAGDTTFGFYGPIKNTQLRNASSGLVTITGTSLATQFGLTEGVVINDTIDWLKFSFNGKLCYIPKKPIRSNVSWGAIYAAGLAYGLRYGGGNGENPYPTGTPVNQGAKLISIRDATVGAGNTNISFRPSLMRRIAATPPVGAVSATETMDLLLRCCTERDRNWGDGKTWSYLGETFGGDSIVDAGFYSWCMDIATDGGDGRSMLPIAAAYMSSASTGSHRAVANSASVSYGWRPVLLQI